MCSSNSMDITSQMQVEIFHRDDLRIATTRCATFDTERGPLRRLADHGNHALAKMRAKCLTQTNSCGGLAFPEGSWGDGSHIDVFAVRAFRKAVENLKLDLGFIRSKQFQFIFTDAKFGSNLQD